MNEKTLVLAHYYVEPEVQKMADFVGDSLDLSLRARDSNAERIVFAGVKFMAETAKIINPQAEVIIPDIDATCSLVTMSNEGYPTLSDILTEDYFLPEDPVVVTYINSSFRVKALSDVIVTSANVEDIITDLINNGHNVFFTPDRNMGAYLLSQHPEWNPPSNPTRFTYYTNAVCEVHDKFNAVEINKVMNRWSDYGKFLLAHPESPLPVLERADFVGSTRAMLDWVKKLPHEYAIIYVATEDGLLHNMKEARPEFSIRQAPTYSGCQCNSCPYMKKNTVETVQAAINGTGGTVIDYIPENIRRRAKLPIDIMLNWKTRRSS